MKNKSIILSSILLRFAACTTSFTLFKTNNIETSSIIKKENTDEVKIGKQIWMSKNLEVTTFSNGEIIEEAKNDKEWRVPSITDWEALVESLGGESVAAPKMKSTFDWGGNTNGDNSSGFNGLPGGHQIHADGIFTNLHAYAYWWTSTKSNDKMACYFNLSHNNKIYYNSTNSKYKNSHAKKLAGLYVRCIKN